LQLARIILEEKENATGKGRPTPSRKEQEKLRKKPLVGDKSKEAKRIEKERVREQRAKIREGMMSGDERYLTSRDRGAQRKLVRDLVDTRFTTGELVLPALVVVVLVTFIDSVEVQFYALVAMWALFLAVAFDAFMHGIRVKKRLIERFGADKVEKGVRWYAAMRSIQMRSLRIPKPQVKRGEKI
jgi:hypothetical protein